MFRGMNDVKVIEVGTTVSAPYAAQTLGALGADVVKVEPPWGDPFRTAADVSDAGISGYFAMCNAGKRGVAVDLKTADGIELFYDLAEQADVVIENFRPGVVDRLGIGYDDLRERNEDLIYCSLSAYGESGPWSDRPGFDPIIQAESGLMSITGERDGEPVRIGVAIVDLLTALWSVVAIQNALLQRHYTDSGAHIDMSMFDAAVSSLTKRAAQYFITGENPERMGTEDTWSVPYGAYPTADDRLIMIGAGRQGLWEDLCRLIDRDDLLEREEFGSKQKRVENREQLNEILSEVFRTKRLETWLDRLQDEIPAGSVSTVEEALTNEHSASRNVATEVEYQSSTIELLNLPLATDSRKHEFDSPPPELGEHNEQVLSEIGYSREEIDRLNREDVIHHSD